MGTTKEEKNNRQVVRYIASLVLYGTNGVAASFISKTSLEIVLLRTLLGCLLLAAFDYAAMVLLNRQAAGFQGLGRVLVQLESALLVVLLYAVGKGGADLRIAPGELWAVLWLGILNTGFASVWYFTSIERLPVREVSVLGYLEPLSALICSAVMLHEAMRPVQILGAGLILGGTLLQRKKK